MPRRIFTETWLKSLTKKQPPRRIDYSEPGRVGFQLRHWPGGALTAVERPICGSKEIGRLPPVASDALGQADYLTWTSRSLSKPTSN